MKFKVFAQNVEGKTFVRALLSLLFRVCLNVTYKIEKIKKENARLCNRTKEKCNYALRHV